MESKLSAGMRIRLNGEERDFMTDEAGQIDYKAIQAWCASLPNDKALLMTIYNQSPMESRLKSSMIRKILTWMTTTLKGTR